MSAHSFSLACGYLVIVRSPTKMVVIWRGRNENRRGGRGGWCSDAVKASVAGRRAMVWCMREGSRLCQQHGEDYVARGMSQQMSRVGEKKVMRPRAAAKRHQTYARQIQSRRECAG